MLIEKSIQIKHQITHFIHALLREAKSPLANVDE